MTLEIAQHILLARLPKHKTVRGKRFLQSIIALLVLAQWDHWDMALNCRGAAELIRKPFRLRYRRLQFAPLVKPTRFHSIHGFT